ncbi:MAG: glutamate 5-kinase [Thermoanaerobaculia bacterium]|nr:glutamate 5-kinase [Thermoanaerobaculia bacterium]
MSSLQADSSKATLTDTFATRSFRQATEPLPDRSGEPRRPLRRVRRLVVKLGTRVLVDERGAERAGRLRAIARSVSKLQGGGVDVIVVSSGAVGLGTGLLGLVGAAPDDESKRACAAVGQAHLLTQYQASFASYGLTTAQVLVTAADLAEDENGLAATIQRLLTSGVVPVVNENDAMSPETVGQNGLGLVPPDQTLRDNDGLAAHVAVSCNSDLLLLLTDVEGVHASDPHGSPGEPVLDRIDDAPALLRRLAPTRERGMSRGGMRSKVAAALFATRGACQVVIASGHRSGVVERVVAGEAIGTFFPSRCMEQEANNTSNQENV